MPSFQRFSIFKFGDDDWYVRFYRCDVAKPCAFDFVTTAWKKESQWLTFWECPMSDLSGQFGWTWQGEGYKATSRIETEGEPVEPRSDALSDAFSRRARTPWRAPGAPEPIVQRTRSTCFRLHAALVTGLCLRLWAHGREGLNMVNMGLNGIHLALSPLVHEHGPWKTGPRVVDESSGPCAFFSKSVYWIYNNIYNVLVMNQQTHHWQLLFNNLCRLCFLLWPGRGKRRDARSPRSPMRWCFPRRRSWRRKRSFSTSLSHKAT